MRWRPPRPPQPLPALEPHRFTVADYYRMLEAGILREDDRVELLGDVVGQRLLDLGCGDGKERLEWARRLNPQPPARGSPPSAAAPRRSGCQPGNS